MDGIENALPSNRTALENALLRIEDAARTAVGERDDSASWQELRDALDGLDSLRSAIRARRKFEAGA